MAENKGMNFRLTISPFTVTGTVGGAVYLHCSTPGGAQINGRKEVYDLAEKLERLGDELSRMHSWEGDWGVKGFDVPSSEKPEYGVLL